MLEWLVIVFRMGWNLARPRSILVAENEVLRHQLIVLRRRAPRQLTVRRNDRIFFSFFSHLFPELRKASSVRSQADEVIE
jgi:hypothetical protein